MKKLVKLLLFVAIVAALVKMVQAKQAAWDGLTESDVRERLESKLSAKVPEDKLTVIQDKVVGTMRARGKLREELEAVSDEPSGDTPAVDAV